MAINVVERVDEKIPIRHVLVSVSDKRGLEEFIPGLVHLNPDMRILSTGGTFGHLERILAGKASRTLFTLEEAVRKVTGAAAERLGWRDRGFVRKNAAADLVVIGPETLEDTATFAEPARFPRGIEHVFINGAHVVNGAAYDAGAKAGTVIRG